MKLYKKDLQISISISSPLNMKSQLHMYMMLKKRKDHENQVNVGNKISQIMELIFIKFSIINYIIWIFFGKFRSSIANFNNTNIISEFI